MKTSPLRPARTGPLRPASTGLFRPRQFATPPAIVLVPYFAAGTLADDLQGRASRRQAFLHSTLLHFDRFAVISGFLGYPHLFTLLALVAGLEEKEVYFLGSAGALAPRFREPRAVQLGEIAPSSGFRRFSRPRPLAMKTLADRSFPVVRGVSVDVIQRETPAWLAGQRALGSDIVEMEIYPLRWFLARPFHALAVLSDRVKAEGIEPFADKRKFREEFQRAFQAIQRTIERE